MNKEDNELKYIDITETILNKGKQEYQLKEQQYFIDNNGNRYNVDDKYVVLNPTEREKVVANMLGRIFGGQVNIIPRINMPEGIKTPDYIINGERFDLKEINGIGSNTLYDAIGKQRRQSSNFIFDISKTKMDKEEAIRQMKGIYQSRHRKWVNILILIKDDNILKAYKRD